MALNIKDSEADRLARDLAASTGETLTTAVTVALRERLERVRGSAGAPTLIEELTSIAERAATLPVLDDRPEAEILGYDEHGLPSRG
jgi:antitoxin VapB